MTAKSKVPEKQLTVEEPKVGEDKGPITSIRIARSIAARATADIRKHVNSVHELLRFGVKLEDPTSVECYKNSMVEIGSQPQLGLVFVNGGTVKCGILKRTEVDKVLVICKSMNGSTESIEVNLASNNALCYLAAVVNLDCLTSKESNIICSMFSATTRDPDEAVKILMQASYDVAYISPHILAYFKEEANEFVQSLSIRYALATLSKYMDKAEALKAVVSAPGSLFSGEQLIRSKLDYQVVKVRPKTLWLTVPAYDTDSVGRGFSVVYQDLNTNCIVTNIDDIRIEMKYQKNIELNRTIRSEYAILRSLSAVANFKGNVGRDSAIMAMTAGEGVHTSTSGCSAVDLSKKAAIAYVDLKDALDRAKALIAILTDAETGYRLASEDLKKITESIDRAGKSKPTVLSSPDVLSLV